MSRSNEIGNIVSELGAMLRSEAAKEETVIRYQQQVRLILSKLVGFNTSGVRRFLGKTLDAKPSYKRFNYYILKKLFKLVKVKWPADLKPPRVPRASISRVRFSPDEIAQLAKNNRVLNARDRYYSTLSIVYGLRRGEFTRLEKDDRKGNRILIRVGKNGDPRWHIVPSEIRPILDGYDFENPSPIRCPKVMSTQFHRICEMCGVETNNGDGWHKIRRTLVRTLRRAGHNRDDIHSFLRWKKKEDIVGIYAGELEPEDLEMIDEKIFQNHPFLSLWGGGG